MTSEKVTAGIYYTSLSTIYWCEMILPCCFFFTRDECTFQSPSITNTQSAPKAEEQEKKTDYVRIFTQPFCVIWQCLAHSSALDHRRCQRCSPSPGLTHGWGQRNPSHLATYQKRLSMWCGAAPENTHSQGRRELFGRQLRLERDLAAPPDVLNIASKSRGDFSQVT